MRIRSAGVANIIAVVALGISLWSASYAYRLGKFSEATYVEEKRSVIRLTAYDLEVTDRDFLEEIGNFLSNPDYKLQPEDAIRIGKLRDETNSVLTDAKRIQDAIDKADFGGDPRLLNYFTSGLEESRKRLERSKKELVDFKTGILKEQKH
jgi:hypothetical protein